MAHQNKIIKAPSKWDLHLAFFDLIPERSASQETRRTARFDVRGPDFVPFPTDIWPGETYRVDLVIDMLEWEDGSGNSWNFKGHVKMINFVHEEWNVVQGRFSTTNRTGWIEYLEKPLSHQLASSIK